jgi:hypothetical protein
MRNPDPRQEAADFLRREGKGAEVGLVSDPWFYTPTLYPMVAAPRAVPLTQRLAAMQAVTDPRIVQDLPPEPAQRKNWDITLLDKIRPRFVVYSSFEWNDVARIRAAKVDPGNADAEWNRAAAFMERLRADYEPAILYGYGGPTAHDLMYVQPTVWIWRRKGT